MSQFDRPDRRAYVIDTTILCRAIRAAAAAEARPGAAPVDPASSLLEDWLNADDTAFDWIYSQDIFIEYEAVLRELGVSDSLTQRIVGVIVERGIAVIPLSTGAGAPHSGGEIFLAAAEAAGEAAVVTSNPAALPKGDRIRILTIEEALAEAPRARPGAIPAFPVVEDCPTFSFRGWQRWPHEPATR